MAFFCIEGIFLLYSVNFICLQLSKQTRLRDAVRNALFPTAEMVISMSREFGVPLTAEDFEGTSTK